MPLLLPGQHPHQAVLVLLAQLLLVLLAVQLLGCCLLLLPAPAPAAPASAAFRSPARWPAHLGHLSCPACRWDPHHHPAKVHNQHSSTRHFVTCHSDFQH